MKKNIIAVILMVLSIQAFAQTTNTNEKTVEKILVDENNNIVVKLSNPNQIGTLEAHITFGSIKITGTKNKDVIIKNSGDDLPSSENDKKAEGLRKISNNSSGLSISEQNNTIVLIADHFPGNITDLEILVPENFNLKLNTAIHGEIVISNVKGNFELENHSGVTLEDVSGNALVTTLHGNIKANFLSWDNNNPMAFSSLNGMIDVTLPANAKFDLKLSSNIGNIYTDFDFITLKKTESSKDKHAQSGVYKVNTLSHISGKVNTGGPEIMMKTLNGNIYLRKGK